MSILFAATVTALTTAERWYSVGLTLRVASAVALAGTATGIGLLAISSGVRTGPRSVRDRRRRPRRLPASSPLPAMTALLIAAISGFILVRQDVLLTSSFRATTALVLFLGYSLAPVLAWGIVARVWGRSRSVGGPTRAERVQAWSTRLRPVGAFAAAALFVSWVVFLPLPEPPIAIDGSFRDWRLIPEFADEVGDAVLRSSLPVFEFTFRQAGTYEATLSVTDSGGGSSTSRSNFSVPNVKPVATFTDGVDGLNVTFDATASHDPDGVIVDYHWTFGDGQVGSGQITTHTYYASKRYDVTLTVTDDGNADSSSTRIGILVEGPNRPPEAAAVFSIQDATLSADASDSFDPEGRPLRFEWDFGDASMSTDRVATHVYAAPGEYEVLLTVFDDQNESAVFRETVSVPNDPPVVEFEMEVEGLSVRVDGALTTDEDLLREFSWAFGDGAHAAGSVARHTYARAGTYLVRLLVEDVRGASAFRERPVTVSVPPGTLFPPVASISIQETDLHVDFVGAASYDPDGRIVDYLWEFGDGATGRGLHVEHLYPRPDVYVARLTVLDEQGLSGTASQTIDLRPAIPSTTPPAARIDLRLTDFSVRFDGLGSSAPAGSIVSYRWTVSHPASGLELVGASVVRDGPRLFLRARAAGDLYPGGTVSSVSFYIHTGSGRPSVPFEGLEPEYVVRLVGDSGAVLGGLSGLFWYYPATSPTAGPGWQRIGFVDWAVGGPELEVRVFLSQILASDRPIRVTCAIEWGEAPVDLLPTWIEV